MSINGDANYLNTSYLNDRLSEKGTNQVYYVQCYSSTKRTLNVTAQMVLPPLEITYIFDIIVSRILFINTVEVLLI